MGQGERHRFGPLVAEPRTRPTPFVKWAGGKGQLLRQMQESFPSDFGAYLEPFLGGGAVFFHIRPERAILGDINAELLNVYWIVQNDVELLMAELGKHESRKKEEEYYYEVRQWKPGELNPVARASRTIFLNKTCYNGLYRVNSSGQFNVPFGQYENPMLYNRENLLACNRTLRGRLLLADDYRKTLSYARENDFVYLDPPYQPVSPTANFTAYTKDSFAENDQEELAKVFAELDERGCKVMLSNSATDFVRNLYGQYHIQRIRASRPISSKAETRGEVEEFLVMNYKP